jgi:hypothetical protein
MYNGKGGALAMQHSLPSVSEVLSKERRLSCHVSSKVSFPAGRVATERAFFYFLFFTIILHSSYIAYGTSAIFSTISMTLMCALASMFNYTILLAVPPSSRRHATAFGLNALLLILACALNNWPSSLVLSIIPLSFSCYCTGWTSPSTELCAILSI